MEPKCCNSHNTRRCEGLRVLYLSTVKEVAGLTWLSDHTRRVWNYMNCSCRLKMMFFSSMKSPAWISSRWNVRVAVVPNESTENAVKSNRNLVMDDFGFWVGQRISSCWPSVHQVNGMIAARMSRNGNQHSRGTWFEARHRVRFLYLLHGVRASSGCAE